MKLSTVALPVAAMGFLASGYGLYSELSALSVGALSTLPVPAGPETARPESAPAQASLFPPAPTGSGRPSAARNIESSSAGIIALQDQITGLRAELSALRSRVLEVERTASVQDGDSAPGRADAPAAREQAERRRQQELNAVEIAFRTEPADARWLSRATTAVEDALSELGPIQSAVRSVECRSQTCRIELSGNRQALAGAMPAFALRVGGLLPDITASQTDNGDDTVTLVLYLSAASDNMRDDNG